LLRKGRLRLLANTAQVQRGPLYPSQLKLFGECRRRYFLKVVERRSGDEPFSPVPEKGKAAHAVLKVCAGELMRSERCLLADLRALVEAQLPRQPYSSDRLWRCDVAEVIAWVNYALSSLDAEALVLGAKLFLRREYTGDEEFDRFELGAVLDLVLLQHENGEPYVEVIDYKCGRSGWEDRLAPVVAGSS
jgi:hypothetical protein